MGTLTVITPCFNEAENLRTCVVAVNKSIGHTNFQHIFIDNSSTDDSVSRLSNLKLEYPHIRILTNSHNVGVFSSLHRALREVTTEWVVPFFAADLQDPPDVIRQMIELQRNSGSDSVFAIRSSRVEQKYLTLMRKMFYRILKAATKNSYVMGTSEFCLIRFDAIKQILTLNDPNPFLRVYLSQLSGNVRYVEYSMEARTKGKSSANLFSLLEDALNGISLVLPSVFSKLLFGSILALGVGVSLVFYALLDIFLLPYNLEQLLSIGISVSGFSMLFGLVSLVGQYVYLIHSHIRTKVIATTTEHF